MLGGLGDQETVPLITFWGLSGGDDGFGGGFRLLATRVSYIIILSNSSEYFKIGMSASQGASPVMRTASCGSVL